MMLGGAELQALSAWCVQRELSWSPADSEAGPQAMMLRPRDSGRPWQRMMLILEEGELRLENELGETLASASDLPALLDAVEGGVGDAPSGASAPVGGAAGPGFIL